MFMYLHLVRKIFSRVLRDSISHFSVRPSVRPSVLNKVVFMIFSAPAHPSATNAAVYTALFIKDWHHPILMLCQLLSFFLFFLSLISFCQKISRVSLCITVCNPKLEMFNKDKYQIYRCLFPKMNLSAYDNNQQEMFHTVTNLSR